METYTEACCCTEAAGWRGQLQSMQSIWVCWVLMVLSASVQGTHVVQMGANEAAGQPRWCGCQPGRVAAGWAQRGHDA